MVLLVLLTVGSVSVRGLISVSASLLKWSYASTLARSVWVVCDGLPILRGWTRELVERCSPGPCGRNLGCVCRPSCVPLLGDLTCVWLF